MTTDQMNAFSAWLEHFNQVMAEIIEPPVMPKKPAPKKPAFRWKTFFECANDGFNSYQKHLAHERTPTAAVMRQWIAVSPKLAHQLFAAGVYHGTRHMKPIHHE